MLGSMKPFVLGTPFNVQFPKAFVVPRSVNKLNGLSDAQNDFAVSFPAKGSCSKVTLIDMVSFTVNPSHTMS
ncbi:hypothetical protein FLJU110815_21200 [Flavobacterium jumunjinense]